jgi:hypothetical protein
MDFAITTSNRVRVTDRLAVRKILQDYATSIDLILRRIDNSSAGILRVKGGSWPKAGRTDSLPRGEQDEALVIESLQEGEEGFMDLLLRLAPYLEEPLRVRAFELNRELAVELDSDSMAAGEWLINPGGKKVQSTRISVVLDPCDTTTADWPREAASEAQTDQAPDSTKNGAMVASEETGTQPVPGDSQEIEIEAANTEEDIRELQASAREALRSARDSFETGFVAACPHAIRMRSRPPAVIWRSSGAVNFAVVNELAGPNRGGITDLQLVRIQTNLYPPAAIQRCLELAEEPVLELTSLPEESGRWFTLGLRLRIRQAVCRRHHLCP